MRIIFLLITRVPPMKEALLNYNSNEILQQIIEYIIFPNFTWGHSFDPILYPTLLKCQACTLVISFKDFKYSIRKLLFESINEMIDAPRYSFLLGFWKQSVVDHVIGPISCFLYHQQNNKYPREFSELTSLKYI